MRQLDLRAVPSRRLVQLGRYGMAAKAPALRRHPRGWRTATVLATTGLSNEGSERLPQVAFAHPISLLVNALGPMPRHVAEQAKATGIKTAGLIGSVKHALNQIDVGVDLIVAQGTEAGGHCGEIATMVLTPEVVDAVGDVPVLSAGGIGTGRQVAAALALGRLACGPALSGSPARRATSPRRCARRCSPPDPPTRPAPAR